MKRIHNTSSNSEFEDIVNEIISDTGVNKDKLFLLVVETVVKRPYDDAVLSRLQNIILPSIKCPKIKTKCNIILNNAMRRPMQGQESKSEEPRPEEPTPEEPRITYEQSQSVEYKKNNKWIPATILKVHTDDTKEAYYTIKTQSGNEVQTESGRLRPIQNETGACSASG